MVWNSKYLQEASDEFKKYGLQKHGFFTLWVLNMKYFIGGNLNEKTFFNDIGGTDDCHDSADVGLCRKL